VSDSRWGTDLGEGQGLELGKGQPGVRRGANEALVTDSDRTRRMTLTGVFVMSDAWEMGLGLGQRKTGCV
jgi:hypothetical protein